MTNKITLLTSDELGKNVSKVDFGRCGVYIFDLPKYLKEKGYEQEAVAVDKIIDQYYPEDTLKVRKKFPNKIETNCYNTVAAFLLKEQDIIISYLMLHTNKDYQHCKTITMNAIATNDRYKAINALNLHEVNNEYDLTNLIFLTQLSRLLGKAISYDYEEYNDEDILKFKIDGIDELFMVKFERYY